MYSGLVYDADGKPVASVIPYVGGADLIFKGDDIVASSTIRGAAKLISGSETFATFTLSGFQNDTSGLFSA